MIREPYATDHLECTLQPFWERQLNVGLGSNAAVAAKATRPPFRVVTGHSVSSNLNGTDTGSRPILLNVPGNAHGTDFQSSTVGLIPALLGTPDVRYTKPKLSRSSGNAPFCDRNG